MSVGFTQTETDTSTAIVDGATQSLMTCLDPANTAFVQGVDSKNMIQMKYFVQSLAKILVSAANKNHALPGEHKIKKMSMLKQQVWIHPLDDDA